MVTAHGISIGTTRCVKHWAGCNIAHAPARLNPAKTDRKGERSLPVAEGNGRGRGGSGAFRPFVPDNVATDRATRSFTATNGTRAPQFRQCAAD